MCGGSKSGLVGFTVAGLVWWLQEWPGGLLGVFLGAVGSGAEEGEEGQAPPPRLQDKSGGPRREYEKSPSGEGGGARGDSRRGA